MSDPGTPVDDPLERFEREHAEALAVLAALEEAAWALEEGGEAGGPGPHLATVRRAHAFLTDAVRRHNEAEERALFPLIAGDAPTGVFVDEHGLLRRMEEELRSAVDAGDAAGTASAALAIVEVLRSHIQRENEVLFPMAREFLGPSGLAEVARRLD